MSAVSQSPTPLAAGRPPCGVCGGPIDAVWAAREMMLGLRDRFSYGECATCRAVQLLDPPADMARHYGAGYYSFGGDLDAEFAGAAAREAAARATLALLSPDVPEAQAPRLPGVWRAIIAMRRLGLSPDARLLDLGCGEGRLPYLLSLAGFRGVEGADAFLPESRTYAGGLVVRRAELVDLPGGWAVIMMHHAFEHLGDPVGVLRQAAARLAPGGRLLLRLPLSDSLAWRRYGADWVQLDAPRHLFLHTRASLARAAAAAGLRIEAVVCDSYEFQFAGSEQYRLDIPLNDVRNWRSTDPPLFAPSRLDFWRRWSQRLNRLGLGDQAAVYLRAA